MNDEFIDTVKFETKKALHEYSMKGQLLLGAKIIGAALLLTACSFLGVTLNHDNTVTSNTSRISTLELNTDIYESIPDDLNTTIVKQNQMLAQSEHHKTEIMAKLRALEKNQIQLQTVQAQHIETSDTRHQVTLNIQAEQHRRTRPVKQSVINRDDIVLLKAQINQLARTLQQNQHQANTAPRPVPPIGQL